MEDVSDSGDSKPGAQPAVVAKSKSRKQQRSPNSRKKKKNSNVVVDLEAQTSNDSPVPPPSEPDEIQATASQSTVPENLIVAELVQEKSEVFLAQAVQVDPNADDKKPIYQHKQFPKIVGGICCVLVIIIVIVAVVVSATGGGDGTASPTPAPTLAPTGISPNYAIIEAQVEPWLVDATQLKNESSPYFKALRWIVYDDEAQVGPEYKTLQQRCILAALYFATSVNTDWAYCGYDPDADSDLCEYTLIDKGVEEIRRDPRWLSGSGECNWAGIGCHANNDLLKAIEARSFQLSGTILPELGVLSQLKDLVMEGNDNLKGPIPSSIGMLQALKILDIGENALTGTLPEEICNALALEDLDISKNTLTGTIPTCLGNLALMEKLSLDKNDFTGTIPSELGKLENLQNVSVDAEWRAIPLPDRGDVVV